MIIIDIVILITIIFCLLFVHRLGGKRPWQFIEFLYSLLLSTMRKHKLMNIDYHVGPACPLMATNKCSMLEENTDSVHVIPINDDSREIKCGKNDLRNAPSVKEWLREILYVHVSIVLADDFLLVCHETIIFCTKCY